MPETAIRIFSPTEGFLNEKVYAIDIKGREDARKIGPFCNNNKELMSWVRWYEKANGKKVKPHFKISGGKRRSITHFSQIIKHEVENLNEAKKTDIHKKTQKMLLKAINKLIAQNKPIPWAFNDKRLTDFPLTGNLLSDVKFAQKEYVITPPFTKKYSLDIGLIGNIIYRKPVILGAIEIENTHDVDLLKTLIVKSLGFPLLTIDIKGVDYNEITEEWCLKRLTETTFNSDDNRRRNYVYLHNMLYPVYLSNFNKFEIGPNHQYIIFIADKDQAKLIRTIEQLKISLKLSNESVKIQSTKKNINDKGSLSLFENEGALAGPNWRDYNENLLIRLIIKRPIHKNGQIYIFHLILTQLLTLHFNCLVGYKFNSGTRNSEKEETIWMATRKHLNPKKNPKYIFERKRFCPKRVSEPINEIISIIPQAFAQK